MKQQPTIKDEARLDEANKKTSVEVSSSDKSLYLDSIINRYEIKHPKPSISKNTAKKMLRRDILALFKQYANEEVTEYVRKIGNEVFKLQQRYGDNPAYDPILLGLGKTIESLNQKALKGDKK